MHKSFRKWTRFWLFEIFFKKSKSHPFFEGFMHKILLKSKKKCSKNSKFSFSSKSLQIHSKHQKSVPNYCATLGKWLGSIFHQRTRNIFGGLDMLQDIWSEREETHYERVSQLKTFPSLHNSIKMQRLDSLPKKHKIIYFWLCIVSFTCSKYHPNHDLTYRNQTSNNKILH